jgi:hypothetical protein
MLNIRNLDQWPTQEEDTMAARIIDLAEYRRQKTEAARRAASVPIIPVPVMVPVLCGFGWVLMPMMMPASFGSHA